MDKIDKFRGRYFFLSNFYEAPVTYLGITYRNNEAAFQAQKVCGIGSREIQFDFSKADPSTAKRLGRRVNLRKDWEEIKEKSMYEICLAKFSQNEELKRKLIATGNSYLEEGNNWADKTWGTVNGIGENKLGKILMEIREELKINPSKKLYELIDEAIGTGSIIYKPGMAMGIKFCKEINGFVWCFLNNSYCIDKTNVSGYKRVILTKDVISDGWRLRKND